MLMNLKVKVYGDVKPADTNKYAYGLVEHTISELCSDSFYGETKVRFQNKSFSLEAACKQHTLVCKLIGKHPNASNVAKDLLNTIKQSIYKRSKQWVDDWYKVPEHLLDLINTPIKEDNTVVAFCPLKLNYYNGEATDIPIYDGYIIATNSTVSFGEPEYLYSYSWFAKVLNLAKVFGLTPNWSVGFKYGRGSERGLCLTAKHAKELQALVNWYVGQAELGCDLSDLKTISNGIDTKEVSSYNFYKDPTPYLDWSEMDTRDFLEPVYADEEEEM